MASDNTDNSLLKPMFTEILGASGTWTNFGFITNEEYLGQLLWRRGIETYDHMRRDATIQGMLKAVKHPLLSATYDIEPASDEAFDQFVARHVENELFNRNVKWRDFLQDALGKCDFGFSVFEKSYELTTFENKPVVGIKELGWRKQWSVLRWATSDDQPGITQQLLSGPVDIPQEKLLTFVNDKEGDNYQGISLLRYIYHNWEMKKRIENLMMVDFMRSLGFPIVEYNPEASQKDQQRMEEILKNFRSHQQQYMFFPRGKFTWDWAKIQPNTDNFIKALEHIQREIDKSVLAQFLDLGGGRNASGSRALSEDHSQLFEKALEAIINEIVGKINSDLIQQLCDQNWSAMPNGYPKLVFSNIGDKDMAAIGEAVNRLGMVDMLTPDPDLENTLRQWLDLPNLPDDIKENYATRVTAQSKAAPLTQLGPSQTPVQPSPTGQPIENPPVSQKKAEEKPTGDQTNVVTRINEKKDRANMPVPNPSSWRKNPKADDAVDALRRARVAAVSAFMEQ
jgi:phage gp29-like protein